MTNTNDYQIFNTKRAGIKRPHQSVYMHNPNGEDVERYTMANADFMMKNDLHAKGYFQNVYGDICYQPETATPLAWVGNVDGSWSVFTPEQ